MTFFPDGVLNDLRKATNSALPSRSTNSRLGVTRDVRISASTKSYRVPGLPYFMHTPAWKLRFQDGDGVLQGDIEAAPTKGTYIVSEVLSPTDFSISTLVLASRIKDAAGNNIPIFTPNYTVTIKSSNDPTLTVTAPVYIAPADADVKLYDLDPAYKWAVWFDPRTLYTDGSEIGANDQLYWIRFGTKSTGTFNSQALSSPRVQAGVLPIACAYMKERP